MLTAPRNELLALSPDQRDELRRRYDPWQWSVERAGIMLPKAGRLDLASRPFLKDVYRDTNPEIVVIKGAQLGFSTAALVRTFWFVTTFPSTAIYTFPTGSDVSRYTQQRINPLITGTAYLRDRIVDVNSVQLKQFRVIEDDVLARHMEMKSHLRPKDGPRSSVVFLGSSSEKDAISIDADLLVHDEEDLSDPQIIEQFESRLDASRFKWKFRLSTPRLPGAGIDRIWRDTDQRRWFVRCSGCNAQFEMAFPGGPWEYSNVEPDPGGWGKTDWERWVADGRPARYVCHRCGKTLSEADRANGRWVVTAVSPQGKAHGYYVSQLAAPWIGAARVLERRRKATWESDFWNLVVGLAWDEGIGAFSREGILARAGDRPMEMSGDGCYVGIDVGAKMDVVVDRVENGVPRTVFMARLDRYADLDDVMARYGVRTAVIDAAPEEHMTREWAAKYNEYRDPLAPKSTGRIKVWRVFYGGSGGKGERVTWNEDNGTVTAARTEVLDVSRQELLTERVLPKFDGSEVWEQYLAHHVNSKRVAIFVPGLENDKVVAGYRWIEVGPDHLFHAATYAMLARMGPTELAPPMLGLQSFRRTTESRVPEPVPLVLPSRSRFRE